MVVTDRHSWAFKSRFRRHAYGWRSSRLAVQRVKEAVSEIKQVRRRDPVLAGEGAVAFVERISPALEQVDSSSGAIGTAVRRAIEELVPILVEAPVDEAHRRRWMDRLFEALQADRIPYIEHLGDFWGELCGTPEIASEQADLMLTACRMAVNPARGEINIFPGTVACLSALFHAGRFDELIEIAGGERVYWAYKRWAVRALAAQGRKAEALRLAEASRGPWTNDRDVDRLCEDLLLASGLVDEAYRRYGLTTRRGGTRLATFRAVASRYPAKDPETILGDLVATTPGEEGKWFAAARSAGLLDRALDLARRSPCDPRTLTRAARDLASKEPAFAVEAGLLALLWLVEGYGYEITAGDVHRAYKATMVAAAALGDEAGVGRRVRKLVEEHAQGFIAQVLARQLTAPVDLGDTGADASADALDRARRSGPSEPGSSS